MIRVTLGRNGDYWLARWRDEAGRCRGRCLGKRLEAGGNVGKREALSRCAEIQQQINAAGPESRRNPTLESWLADFLRGRPDLAPATVGLYRLAVRSLVGHFGASRIGAITRAGAAEWAASLAGEPGTVGRYARNARALFAEAVDRGLIRRNPFVGLRLAKADATPWAYQDLATFERLVEFCAPPWPCLLGLARLAGLRRGEILRLDWPAVDLATRRLTVESPGRRRTTKHRTRQVPIVPRLHDLMFAASMSDRGGNRVCGGIRPSEVSRQYRAICRRAGIAPISRPLHTMRKSCETDWARVHPIHVVAAWLGNSPKVALAYYLQPTDEDFQEAAESPVSRMGGGNGPAPVKKGDRSARDG